MLTKKDLASIGKIFDSGFDVKIKNALTEFFETLILPYFEHNEKDHAEIKATLKAHDKRFDDHDKRFDDHDKRFDDHDKRFDDHDKRFDTQDKELDSIYRKLEKNEDDHDEIFRQLHDIDQHIGKQAKRIDRLEAISTV